MTRFCLSLLLIASCFATASAQNAQFAFRVYFTDKNATTHSLSNPLQYLSQRAIDRRSKYNTMPDSTDLPVVNTYIDSVLHETNGVLHLSSRWQNSCVILLEDSTEILSLQNIAFVKSIKKVAYYANGLHEKPGVGEEPVSGNKPTDFDANYYGGAWNQIHLCNGEYLHQQGKMGQGKLIAVIDVGFTGVNTAPYFDSMFQQGRLLDTWNYILDTSYVFGGGQHGCQVLSCMASFIPESHVGTAPRASYALYATDDLTSEQAIEEDNFAAATERADSLGVDLITTSLGYNYFDNPADSYDYADLDGNTTLVARAANAAARKGIMVIASAGNEGSNSWQHILTPGDADSAMTIGSVNVLKEHAASSGIGPSADGDLKPNVSAMGVQASVISSSGNITTQNGTSFATPVLAGLTACLMQADASLHPMEIRALIESVSDSFANPNNNIGNGVPDFRKAYDLITGIDEVTKVNDAFLVYPNPAGNKVYISGKNYNGALGFAFYDLQGRVVLKGITKTGNDIDLQGLNNGLYLLKLHNNKQFQVTKLLVR
jgi:serine protease AprX